MRVNKHEALNEILVVFIVIISLIYGYNLYKQSSCSDELSSLYQQESLLIQEREMKYNWLLYYTGLISESYFEKDIGQVNSLREDRTDILHDDIPYYNSQINKKHYEILDKIKRCNKEWINYLFLVSLLLNSALLYSSYRLFKKKR